MHFTILDHMINFIKFISSLMMTWIIINIDEIKHLIILIQSHCF